MRLIDADALIIDLHDEGEKQTKWGQLIRLLYSTVVAVINDAPTIDPVRRGKWEVSGNTTHYYICSICGKPGDGFDNYCRSCGAKMEERENG